MTLRGEVHHDVGLVLFERRLDRVTLADVRAHEAVSRIISNVRQALQVARVGQRIEIDDVMVRVLYQETAEVGTDEAGSAGD